MHNKSETHQGSGSIRQDAMPVEAAISARNDQPSCVQFPVPAPKSASVSTGIMCGTDFSEASTQALEVAAALAKRLDEPLTLMHTVSDRSQENLPAELRESLSLYAHAQLHEEEERLRVLKVQTVEILRVGAPELVLPEEAVARRARLLVLAAEKVGFPSRWFHGGVSERIAEAAPVPTLVVRDSAPLLRWMSGERRLRVFVGADFSAPSEAALLWVDWLRKIGPCDIVVACLESTPPLYMNHGLFPSLLMDEMVLKSAHIQERFFRHRIRTLLGASRVRVHFETDWSCSDAHLIQLAVQERADLIVTGTHSRHGWHRLGHHSVSRGVLRYAPLNVACVPCQAADQAQMTSSERQSTLQTSTP